jgi:hypothetical protein
LRAPTLGQELGDQLPQLAVGLNPPPVAAAPPRSGAAVSLERPVASGCGVAAQLTRDRRWCPVQLIGNLPDTQACEPKVGDLDPLVLRHVPRADLAHGQPLERRDEPGHLTMTVDLVTT